MIEHGITGVVLERYRVFRERTVLAIGPLTVLAGENSAGKSSAMHPLLLLKQTIDTTLDPGPLLLDGDNVKLTDLDQMFTRKSRGPMCFGVWTTDRHYLEVCFGRGHPGGGLRIERMSWKGARGAPTTIEPHRRWRGREVVRRKFLLGAKLPRRGETYIEFIPERVTQAIQQIVHVSGMRGSLGRVQQSAAVGDTFPGTFDLHVARIVELWQERRATQLAQVNDDLIRLGLTWKVEARRLSDVALELRVGRLKKATQGGARDMVSLADVGLGVSQVLPALVALRAARKNQLVYIEQPELHLHPNAQVALAAIIASAVHAGIRVVLETHSSLLLLGIQTAIAEGQLAATDVRLHWFSRDARGDGTVETAVVSPEGSFGAWPADFDDVTLHAEDRFLSANEAAQRSRA